MRNLIMLYKKEILFVLLCFVVLVILGQAIDVNAAWTPLVSSTDFNGISTDVTTVGTGIVTVCIIVVGVFLVVKAMSH